MEFMFYIDIYVELLFHIVNRHPDESRDTDFTTSDETATGFRLSPE